MKKTFQMFKSDEAKTMEEVKEAIKKKKEQSKKNSKKKSNTFLSLFFQAARK